MTLLIVDHLDSFTHNLANWFSYHYKNTLLLSCSDCHKLNNLTDFSGIVFSPGPGHPVDYPSSIELYQKIPKEIPFLGVCLGHQIFLHAEGAQIEQVYDYPKHGHQINIQLLQKPRFLKIESLPGRFVMYNSLGCKSNDSVFNTRIHILAEDQGVCLMAEHHEYFRLGVQFHPESFASPNGDVLLKAFLGQIKC